MTIYKFLIFLLLCCGVFVFDSLASTDINVIRSESNFAAQDTLQVQTKEAKSSSNLIVLIDWSSILPLSSWVFHQSGIGKQMLYSNAWDGTQTIYQNGAENTAVIINIGDMFKEREEDTKKNQAVIRQSGSGNKATIIQN